MEDKQMMKRNNAVKMSRLKVRVNTVVSGEPVRILLDLKRRGIVLSVTDALVQRLLALWEKVLKQDLAMARLRTLHQSTLRRLDEET